MGGGVFDPILARIARTGDDLASVTRLGTVTAIDATDLSLTVEIAGQAITGVRWLKRYTPGVGHFVVLTRTGESWVVLDELSRDLTGPGFVAEQVTVSPDLGYNGSWWSQDPPGSWGWASATTGFTRQGRINDLSLDGYTLAGGVMLYPDLVATTPDGASVLPPGATVTSVKVRFYRSTQTGDRFTDANKTPLVSPVLYGHARTSGPTSGSPASQMVAGFGPWRPGTLARGAQAQWDLPASWVTAWLAGTIRGLGVWVDTASESAFWDSPSGRLTIAYTIPA